MMILGNVRFLSLIVAVAAASGCAHRGGNSAMVAGFDEPRIAEGGSIRTYGEYAAACEAAQKEYGAAFEKRGGMPAALVVGELARLPSAASRRYGAALAGVLRRHGVKEADAPMASGGTSTVTYAELAKVSALTGFLHGGGDQWVIDVSPELWRDLVAEVVAHCPCDDAAIRQVATVMFVFEYDAPPGPVRRQWKQMIRQALARVLEPKRPMNLTTVWPALGLSGAGEFLYTYFSTIDDPNGHDMVNLFERLEQAQRRAARMRLPDDLRKAADEHIARFKEQEKGWKEQLAHGDAELLSIYKATPVMKAFCAAVNRRDDAAVRAYLAAEVLDQGGDMYSALLGTGHDRIAFDYVTVAYGGDRLMMCAEVSGPAGRSMVSMYLSGKPQGGTWRVEGIRWPEGRGKKGE